MLVKSKFLLIIIFLIYQYDASATDYFIHPKLGNDSNNGLTKISPLKTLSSVSKIKLQPGDRILLASNQLYLDGIKLINQTGTKDNPIIITTVNWNVAESKIIPAIIDFKVSSNGVLIQDCNFIEVSNLNLTADGFFNENNQNMRCGVLVKNTNLNSMEHIIIKNLRIDNVYYENYGYKRGDAEVRTANGTQKYGWGIRVINQQESLINNVKILNCSISNVSHTGIKLTGNSKNITEVTISNNIVEKTGGPGIQMSLVKNVYINKNFISHSGSNDDSRKWGRGSGLWTWGASNILIEKNKFLYANGPGDSAGAHIDYNCDNVVLQYNISAYNAGGFCEILGNNYNCIYRYNLSVNDGHRVKGIDGAFQEGKILWLSGYQGTKKKRKGPVNSYIYNNTIYCDSTVVAKIAIDNTSNGILIANNIFYLEGITKAVLGDQYKPDNSSGNSTKNVFFKNNLFLNENNWPNNIGIFDASPIIGNPEFVKKGGIDASDYIPKNIELIKNKGIDFNLLPNNNFDMLFPLKLEKDILGNLIESKPDIGAIDIN